MRTGPAGSAIVGTLTAAILLFTTGCTREGDAPAATADTAAATAVARSSPPAAAMRLDKPAKLLGTWPESVNRVLRGQAEQNMGNFKKLLSTEPTSAMGTAFVRATEVYTRKDGLHIPGDDQRVILVSGVSGTIADPTATVDRIFAGLPNVTDVAAVPPGPLSGMAGCGVGPAKTGIPVGICVWGDEHTVGMVTFIGFAPADDPHAMFGQIRAELERPAR
ncbi:hypothetical protein DDE19_06980 [Micromonospora ureilytica]|uniref:Uncharacterized protein n=1 Tax=Micromonospora ureilytica TaxID=709868 RepID=A0A3N9Y0B8_9ACTN|nr:hypothetical protein [Micromonospora ureilytica]RQX18640.1 hypothetical protein DDE19_06980 [Micromonospora ureilytica]